MEPLPDDVRQFLAANVDSLEQLEALRILSEGVKQEWRVADFAAQIQATPELTLAHVAALEARGLLHCERREDNLFCRYGCRSPDLDQQLQALLACYRQRPVTMIRLVSQRATDALRDFSDAFKLRKEN